jgi:hypothetical protein
MRLRETIEALQLRLSFQASDLIHMQQKTAKVILNIVILLIACSCSTTKMTINGVPVKKREMAVRNDELKIYIASFFAGAAIGLHYKDKFKK